MLRLYVRKMFVVPAILGLAGCSENLADPSSLRPIPRVDLSVTQIGSDLRAERVRQSGQLLDSLFLETDVDAPGFAGLYYSDTDPDRLILRLVGGEQRGAALASVRLKFRNVRGINGGVTVLPASYSFRQLSNWRYALETGGVAAIVTSDVDEVANRVYLGVRDVASRNAVLARARALGIPEAALFIPIEQPSRLISAPTLDSTFRPLRAGTVTPVSGAAPCSAGPIVKIGGAPYMITASHCTNGSGQIGGLNNALFWQGFSPRPEVAIGSEYVDPAFSPYTGPCLAQFNETCRHSDAALVRLVNSDGSIPNVTVGLIARTRYYRTGDTPFTVGGTPAIDTGSTEVVGTWQTVQEDTTQIVLVGSPLHKMGRTTGATYGNVKQACTKFLPPGQGLDFSTGVGRTKVLHCQYKVATTADVGDSGGPVFILWSDNVGGIRGAGLVGIAIASGQDFDGRMMLVVSPMSGIRKDLSSSMVTF